MNTPKVSIVMAAYNGEKYIADAIQSVVNQTFADFDLLIIDDGSVDNTSAVVASFLSDKRIKYFFQTNKGTSSARNRGIVQATGEYIGFIDQDDLFLPDKIEATSQFLDDNPSCAMVYTDMFVTDAKGETICEWLVKKKWYAEGDIYLNLLKECFFIPIAVLIRKSVFCEVGLFDEDVQSTEDIDLWLRIARNNRIGLIKSPLAKWRTHDGNFSKNSKHQDQNYIKVLKKQLLLGLIKDENCVVRRGLSSTYFDLALIALSEGDSCLAQDSFADCLSFQFRFGALAFWMTLFVRIFDGMLSRRFLGKY